MQCKPRTNKDPQCSSFEPKSDVCLTCSKTTYLSTDAKTCVPFPSGILGCTVYSQAKTCQQCVELYYLSNNTCLLSAKINNCLVYAGNAKCKKCYPDFYLESETSCVQASASQCYTYASPKACASCDPATDTGLKTVNGITSCLSKGLANCKSSTDADPF